jgi:hypothetical protein
MTGRSVNKYLLIVFLAYFFAACQPSHETPPHQSVLEWPEQHLLFVADVRQGKVQSFFLGNGAPIPFAQTHDPQRSSVRDLQLDRQRGQLWVLGDRGVSVHKARGLILQRHIALDTRNVSTLSVDEGHVWLVDDAGERIGQIDRGTLVASWRSPDRHG